MPLFSMLAGLLLLAFLGACCLAVAACTRYEAALLPLPALCGAVAVLYVAGLCGALYIGLFLAGGGLLAAGVYCGVRAGWRAIRDAAGCPGFWLFLGGAAFIWVLFAFLQPMFTQWDEFTAWGLAPKMVSVRAQLYVADPVNLRASFTYPATSLLSFVFQLPGAFAEWKCLAALDILALAAFAPLTVLPRARWPHSVLLFAAAAVAPFFFSTAPVGTASTVYANAMADLPLGCLFGGSLCLYYAAGGRRGGFYATALPLAMLAMTKDIGLAYGLMAVFLIGLDQLFARPRPAGCTRLRAFAGGAARTAVLAAPVLAVFLSWSRYTAAVSPTAGAAATVGSGQMGYGAVLLGGLRQLLGIGREARFAELMQAMGAALFTRRVCLLGPPVVVLAGIAALALLAWLAAPKGPARRRVAAGFAGMALCFAALYLFHLILYYYNFSELESSQLKDYARYLMPCLLGWLMAVLCQLGQCAAAAPARSWRRRLGAGAVGLAALGLLGVFAWRGVPAAGFWTRADSLYTVRADVQNRAQAMNAALAWDDRVLVISQGDDGTRWYYYRYELTAHVVNGYGGVWLGDDDYSGRWDTDFMNLGPSLEGALYEYTAVCTPAALVAYMEEQGCDYLLIDRSDGYLEQDFSPLFAGGLTGDQPATLYRYLGAQADVPFEPVVTVESGVSE